MGTIIWKDNGSHGDIDISTLWFARKHTSGTNLKGVRSL